MASTLLVLSLFLPRFASAYSWRFQHTPQQCGNLSITVSGDDGKPPYRVLILPSGASPLANNVEARRIIDQPFDGNSSTVSFQLKYPENSQFVAVVSDATAFGSGGTSVAAQVTGSDDSSCFDATKSVSPQFVFSIEPENQVVQCQPMRIWWNKNDVRGNPTFQGVIPGGKSFTIPQGPITDVVAQGTGFSWTPSLRGGTTIILLGGDDRGNGSAGSVPQVVSAGINPNSNCLNDLSPSSTPGSPAGGSYPTSTNGSGVGGAGGGGKSTNTGAIVGGVIGGLVFLAALILALFFFRRRQKVNRVHKEPVDLLDADEGDESNHPRNDLPQYYQPEPFMVPDPTLTSTEGGSERPLSGFTRTSYDRSTTPDHSVLGGGVGSTTTSGRKGVYKPMRPVNIIQHDDAGPSEATEGQDQETIELPPAYTSVKKPGVAQAQSTTPAQTETNTRTAHTGMSAEAGPQIREEGSGGD